MAETQSDLEKMTESFIREYATPRRQGYLIRDYRYSRINLLEITNSDKLREEALRRFEIASPSIVVSYDVVNDDGVPGVTSIYFPSSYRGLNVVYANDTEGRFIPATAPKPKSGFLGYHRGPARKKVRQ